MNPWLIIGLMVAWAASVAGAFSFGVSYEGGQEAKREALARDVRDKIRDANQEFADSLGKRVEDRLSKLRIVNQTYNNEIRTEREIHREILENPDCVLPGTTRGLLNRARGYGEEGPGTRKPEGGVPSGRDATEKDDPRRTGE